MDWKDNEIAQGQEELAALHREDSRTIGVKYDKENAAAKTGKANR